MPLRLKLLLFVLPLVIGPLLGLGWLAYDGLRTNAETTLLREMDTLLEQVTLSEETHRRTALANAKLFGGSNLLKRYLFAPEDERVSFLLLPLLNLFASYHDAYADYGDIRLIDPDGKQLARYLADEHGSASALVGLDDYLDALRASDQPALARYVRNQDGEPRLLVGLKLVFVDPVFEDNSFAEPSLRGFLLLVISPEHLRQQVEKGSFGRNGRILFADAEARRLFADGANPAGEWLSASLHASVTAATSAHSVQRTEQAGHGNLVSARELTPNLSLIALLSEDELDAAGAALGRKVVIIALVTLLLASTLLLIALHLLVLQPVRQLERGAQAIGAGNLQMRLVVRGRDELAHLAAVFNHMAANLQTSQQEKDRAQQEALDSKQLAIDSLRKADRLKDDFLANTSHELRTPLHGIIGLAESLRGGAAGPLTAATDDNLRLIIASGRRLATLVNDILDFSRLRHRELRLNLTAVDVRAVCELVLQLVASLAEPKGLELINKVPQGLPPALADENRLQQILYNLLGNAIKFTKQGWVQVCAEVDDDGRIALRVCDSGPGIAPEQHEAVFASFEQLDSGAGRVHGGTGLGLAVTRSLVQALGGSISLESQPGAGACFNFTLPVADPTAQAAGQALAADMAPSAMAEAEAGTAQAQMLPGADRLVGASDASDTTDAMLRDWRGNGQLVLVVDDDPVNLRVLDNQLGIQGFRVQTAPDGEQALALMAAVGSDQSDGAPKDWITGPPSDVPEAMHGVLPAEQPSVVLIDVMMPHMNGFELCQRLRQRFGPDELPIVFLTARNREGDILHGFSVGGNDYLPKPFSRGELIARVHAHASLVERTQSLRLLTRELEQRVTARTHELEAARAEMERLAMLDGLTQLLNRRALDLAVEREWSRAQRHAQPLSALMLDVDFFKAYNDRYGHPEGDRCLQAVADVMCEQARRGGDLVARYGGEEFCVLVADDADQALPLAERIRAAVAALGIAHDDSEVADHVTVSIGVATRVPDGAMPASALLERADAALYRAKRQGRNCVLVDRGPDD
ncbi:diguanylate cyclase [Thiorhodovibrio frisius]|uniref:histidine kinase n=1 Tax=Thiorhodovibrio frisius TaxID=631362 RepID=H8YYP9_9GAMM|nr:diguanylate cyclase [Thiorhodovibrio frisius]EIC23575.1 diguanylate cyclase (GGDEF) domain-containing protein [Thiorhodovibrio frisius]WPL23338.1 Signal transduction histidine-protein kinase BarA [Thiorhodovibrio frisius]